MWRGWDSRLSRTRLVDVVTGGWHDAVIATLSISFANQSIISDCLLCLITFKFFLFSPCKKFKTSPRNLYTAAKDCNIQKVLSLLGEFCIPSKPREKSISPQYEVQNTV